MNWSNENKFIEGTYLNFKLKEKIAAFDLDGTLIKVKSGSKFPKDENDWVFFNDNVIEKLKDLNKEKYCLVIISNQAGISKGKQDINQWKNKIELILKKVNLPFKVFASIDNDVFRKPYKTLWNLLISNNEIRIESFYCGDACGRKNDFSDTDYKFSLNCDIKFYTPEELFAGSKDNNNYQVTYNVDLKLIEKINKTKIDNFKFVKKDMIIMTGYPGSGKSTFVTKYLESIGYKRINMDTLKTKAKCIKECEKQLDLGNSIVIDNTNPNSDTRKIYIEMAIKKKYNIKSIEMICDQNLAYHTAHYRCYKSQGKIKSIPMLVYHKYKKIYQEPNKNEGFNEIIKINFCPPSDLDYYDYYY